MLLFKVYDCDKFVENCYDIEFEEFKLIFYEKKQNS
jgi:hypothetical protein